MQRPDAPRPDTPVRLAAPVARRVRWRSLTRQASWNDQRMQNLGLLVCLAPWLRRQALDRDERRRICRRYYGFFNTNPYLASFVIGGLLRLERDRAAGAIVPDRQVAAIRDTLARACGSLGDQVFWLGLRPTLMLVSCGLALVGRWELVLALLGVFTAAQLWLRGRGLALGFGGGPDVVDVLVRPVWHRTIGASRRAALVLTGLLVGVYFAGACAVWPALGAGRTFGVVVAGLGLPLLVRQKAPGEAQVLLGLAAAAGLVLVIRAA